MIKLVDLYSGNTFDPEKVIAEGYSGVIFKCGQGAWADVPRYHPTWWAMAKEAGLLCGWYWLCDSRQKSSNHIEEMERFKIFDDVGELGFWVDVEKPVISMPEMEYWKTPYAGHANLIDFVYLLKTYGIKPGIYTGPGAYSLVMRNAPKVSHEYLAQFDLWTAQYPYHYIEGVSKPTLYGAWQIWTFWQWREGPDVNIFNGSDQEFKNRYGSVVVPEPPTEVTMKYAGNIKTTAVPYVNVRSTPGGQDIGDIQPGTPFTADMLQGMAGFTWIHLITPIAGWVRTDTLDYHEVVDVPPVVVSSDENININLSGGRTTITVNNVEVYKTP